MDTVKIIFNGKDFEFIKGTSFYDISKSLGVQNALGVKINNEVFSLEQKVANDCVISFVDTDDLIGNKMYKAGLKFIFEVALTKIDANLEINYEHSVPNGMLGVINSSRILNQVDIDQIKEEMFKIIKANKRIEKLNVLPREAIKYYEQVHQDEKALNIQNISDNIVTLYKLDNHLNYFYTEMPYSTGVINEFNLVYLGNNRIIFLFPRIGDHGKSPEYVHYDNILNSFKRGKEFLKALNMPYVTNLNQTLANGDIKKFIQSNELTFSLNIAKIAEEIERRKSVKFILIAGPSSSGKTTTNKRLGSYLQALGYDTINISLDDYFLNRVDSPKDELGNYDFESLQALDIKLFNENIASLLNHEEVRLPKYNFMTGEREFYRNKTKMQENSIFLIEGLHALNDELLQGIEKDLKYKIYLSPFIPINIDRHNYISTLDLRLLRRIVRDNRTRGYDVTATIDSWQNVRNGEEKYIFPFIHQADTIVNTALAYEVGVLKVYVEPLLYSVSINSQYYEEARRLLDFLKQFYPIPGEYINDDSILREFIGGKNND